MDKKNLSSQVKRDIVYKKKEPSSSMPTIWIEGQYTFIFFSSDKGEPPHIHVKHERRIAKFWLSPVVLAKNRGFAGHELNEIVRIIRNHEVMFLEAWHDYFSS